jgi:peptidyl-prolyl cis-trans isomerase C
MHVSSKSLALVTALLLAPLLSASMCKTDSGSASGGALATTTGSGRAKITGLASLSPEQAAKVLATVGKRNITLGDYVATLERMDQFDRLRYQSPERRKELLEELINIELLAQEAERQGYDKDPVAQEERRQILKDAYLSQLRKDAPKPVDVPAGEVRAYFDAHRADYKDPERRRASAIVLKDELAAKLTLKDALATNTALGWGELARARSMDPAAHRSGGGLGHRQSARR